MNSEINTNLQKIGTWRRIFFMLIFAVILAFVRLLLWGVVLLQVASSLVTGTKNTYVLGFGKSLSVYVYGILVFLTYNTDEMPFPFSDWANQTPPDSATQLKKS